MFFIYDKVAKNQEKFLYLQDRIENHKKHKNMTQEELFKKLVAHCKEYGFIFPSSEIYDGLGAVYDYGQNGVELKNNIKRYWWDSMVKLNENIVGIDAAIFMPANEWKRMNMGEYYSSIGEGTACTLMRIFYVSMRLYKKRIQNTYGTSDPIRMRWLRLGKSLQKKN